jgi:hypothetical protein
MKRAILTSLAALALWGSVGVNFASAQFGTLGQQYRPNPFINPTTPGSGYGYTYGVLQAPYDPSRVDPILTLQRLNAEGALQSLLNKETGSQTGPITGHSVTFLDYSRYFPLNVPTGGGVAPSSLGGAITNPGPIFSSYSSGPAGLQGGYLGGFRR